MKELTKRCSCGNTINNPLVSSKACYSKIGLLWLSLAFSVKPKEVIFICQKCGEVIDRTSEPEILEKYRYNSDLIE